MNTTAARLSKIESLLSQINNLRSQVVYLAADPNFATEIGCEGLADAAAARDEAVREEDRSRCEDEIYGLIASHVESSRSTED